MNLGMSSKKVIKVFHISILFLMGIPLWSLITSIKMYPITKIESEILMDALAVSGKSSLIMMILVILIGTPMAYISARIDYRGKNILELFVNLPLILPPAVAGLLLLMTFGKNGFIGSWLYELGLQIPFSMTAVILAQLFVALPLYLKTVTEGFKKVDSEYEKIAMSLGDTRWKAFLRVSLPLARDSIIIGAIMAWARGIAEFGATIMFAGNMPKVTQTLPLAIYSAMESDMNTALHIARIMVMLSFLVLAIVYQLSKKEKNNA